MDLLISLANPDEKFAYLAAFFTQIFIQGHMVTSLCRKADFVKNTFEISVIARIAAGL
jgi:hypothetical protein